MNKSDVKNVVESIDDLTRNMKQIAEAITYPCIKPAEDAAGGYVMSFSLMKISLAINDLAAAVREKE